MPTHDVDLSNTAVEYVRASIANMPGNPGQEVLVNDLDIDCNCIATVYIAGLLVEVTIEGNIKFNSNHPDAISEIINKGEEHFNEFKDGILYKETNISGGTSVIYNQNIIETIRGYAIEEAFASL